MCGIAGIFGNVENREQLMQEMLRKQQNRGPELAPKRPLQTSKREWLANDLKTFVETTY